MLLNNDDFPRVRCKLTLNVLFEHLLTKVSQIDKDLPTTSLLIFRFFYKNVLKKFLLNIIKKDSSQNPKRSS